ncbi:Redoxin domain protein [Halorhabdus tiamatea SARL4B]|uniref:Redoxin domain protein n=1 Tax=Halorhabdus tiamatea SARL4B TaxID=1033806 RepID=F7PPW6_9EURY|nr:TlpA disulfide reductase family protein [Halorhabdus tiamatea]ERJ05007.1 Redoxin domain protein [Halorhabdus tiamatea SARL4B]CCQ32432.1 thioredoxin domain protein [Halorhabdus tiamatea SARL4B]
MRRRELLAGIGGAAVVGGSAYLAFSPSNSGAIESDGRQIDPVDVETFETANSPDGELTVPVEGSVTVIDLFATWCQPCKPALEALRTVHRDNTDVQFVSVTNEALGGDLSRADVLAWWDEFGGPWAVGHDPEGTLLARLGTSALPFSAVANPDGRIVWAEKGVPEPERVDEAISAARS